MDESMRNFGMQMRLLATVVAAVALLDGCGPACRAADVEPLTMQCDSTSAFTGEIHFDSEASYDTFLRQECMLDATDAEITVQLDAVDFSVNAVFVAVGPVALDDFRCLQSRDLAIAEVCNNGLKVSFEDEFRPAGQVCPAERWTTAFTIARSDLRAALDAAAAAGF